MEGYKINIAAAETIGSVDELQQLIDNTTSVNFENKNSPVSIFPLPAHDFLEFSGNESLTKCQIFCLNGVLVFETELNGAKNGTIKLSKLNPGFYMVVFRGISSSSIAKIIIH